MTSYLVRASAFVYSAVTPDSSRQVTVSGVLPNRIGWVRRRLGLVYRCDRFLVGASFSPPIRSRIELTKLTYRPDIDGLRALAIVSVVTFHVFPDWLQGGFVGVDIFFVISGFLISQIIFSGLVDSSFRFAQFYARRIRRIFPSLIVVLLATLLLGWFVLPPDLYASAGKHTVAGAAFLANVLDWTESGYFDVGAKPLLHLWSLGIEEQFYIVWPLLLWASWRLHLPWLVVILALAFLSFGANLQLAHNDTQAAFYLPHARFWELLVGCFLASCSLTTTGISSNAQWVRMVGPMVESRREQLRDLTSAAGFAAICVSVIFISPRATFPGWWALLPTIGTALMICGGPSAWLNRRLLSSRPLVWIGLISFQLYLWHWPVLFLIQAASAGSLSHGQRPLALGCSAVLAWLTWACVDKPIRFGKKLRRNTLVSCAALIVTGALGYIVFALQGIPARYPQSAQGLANFRYLRAGPYREGTCFLKAHQPASDFYSCQDETTNVSPKAKTILLWGDSHAAHLYPGLKDVLKDSARLTQFTASGCPPIVDTDYRLRIHCRGVNEYVLDKVRHQPPDEVILAAEWQSYDWKLLSKTIPLLKAAGVRSIDIVGPVPQWNGSLVETIYRYFDSAPNASYVPQRMKFGLLAEPVSTDEQMAAYFSDASVNYVSAIRILCNEDGCLTRTGDYLDSLTAWDSAHLTTSGSVYLVSHSGLATRR